MARNDSANEIAVLVMFDQDLLCLFKFRGSRSTLAYRHDSIHHAFGFYPKGLEASRTPQPFARSDPLPVSRIGVD